MSRCIDGTTELRYFIRGYITTSQAAPVLPSMPAAELQAVAAGLLEEFQRQEIRSSC